MSAVLPARSAGGVWRAAAPAAVLVLSGLLGLYGETFASIARTWLRSDTYAHGMLVVPISLWLVWRRRAVLADITPRPAPWMLLPLALATCAWALSDLAGVNAAAQFAATSMLVLAVPALLGLEFARAIAFPLAFLFFMVPFGEFTTPTMMAWTADVTVAALRAIGIPVYRDGMQFMIPSGTWSVVEACSGVRYLIASFMVGTLFAYLNYTSASKRLLFCVVSLVVPIVANWLRAIMIVLLGHYSGNRVAVGVDHLLYGWVFFGVVIALMFWLGARWADRTPSTAPALVPTGLRSAVVPGWGSEAWVTVALVLALGAFPQAASRFGEAGAPGVPDLRLPDALNGTLSVGGDPERFPRPVFVNPTAQASRHYGDVRSPVMVHIAYYRRQSYGNKLANSQNVIVRSEDPAWAVSRESVRSVKVGPRDLDLRSVELRAGPLAAGQPGGRVHLLQVFWVDGELLIGNRHALFAGLWGRLMGRSDDAAAITFMLAGVEPATVEQALDAFVARHLDSIVGHLADLRARGAATDGS
jgi:exosortase A